MQNPRRNTASYSLLASFTGSNAYFVLIVLLASMHSLLVSVALSVVFSNWLGQAILLGFSLGSTHMFTRFTHFQPCWYNSLTLWVARRHDQQQLTNSRHLLTKWPRVIRRVLHVYCACASMRTRAYMSRSKNGRLAHSCTMMEVL